MLRGINPLLGGDLLKVLDDMGHGDQLMLVDRNFPAHAGGRQVIRLGDSSIEEAATAILGLFPLDSYVEHPLERMEVDNDPTIQTEAAGALLSIAQVTHENPLEFGVVPRFDFYERARNVFAIVQTLDARPYGCFILSKGVIND